MNLRCWGTSNVKDMRYMIDNAVIDGSTCNVKSVNDINHMFDNAIFNGGISMWNMRSVTNMSTMSVKMKISMMTSLSGTQGILRI